MIRSLRSTLRALVACAFLAGCLASRGQDGQGGGGPVDPFEWFTLEEEQAPDQPLLRARASLLGWLETRTRIRADAPLVPGTPLRDLEGEQGLQSGGPAGELRLSLGGLVRAGLDLSAFRRRGAFTVQDGPVVYEGVSVASRPGDLVKAGFDFYNCGTTLEWNPLVGQRYRIWLTGGLRYFRFDLELQGVSTSLPAPVLLRSRGELLSPSFGGGVELTPFPYLRVHTRIEFMNWSWRAIGLKDCQYFDFSLGASVWPIPDVLGVLVEYRFMSVRAETRQEKGRSLDGGVLTNGVSVGLEWRF